GRAADPRRGPVSPFRRVAALVAAYPRPAAAPDPEGGRWRQLRNPPGRDVRTRRRVWVRKVDSRPADRRGVPAYGRQHSLRRYRPGAVAHPSVAVTVPPTHADDLPGPLRQPQSPLEGP